MYIKVRAKAEAKREEFKMVSHDHFIIAVKEPAARNEANKRIIELVAKHFKIAPAKVRIKSGHHSPSKIISIMQ